MGEDVAMESAAYASMKPRAFQGLSPTDRASSIPAAFGLTRGGIGRDFKGTGIFASYASLRENHSCPDVGAREPAYSLTVFPPFGNHPKLDLREVTAN